jgi:hypothetical protein
MKVIISENLISAFALIISIFLIFFIAGSLFSTQTERAGEVAYSNIAKSVAELIDRAAAEAGSAFIEYNVPSGLQFNMNITYRNVIVTPKGMEPVSSSFSSVTHTGDYGFRNPKKLCVVKNRYDRTILVKNGPCECNTKDSKCDPECVVEGVCDRKCATSKTDYTCIPMCASDGDGICDPDCYTNNPDSVWDSDCAQQNPKPDGICDPDSDNIRDGFCDIDCFYNYNFSVGVCDPDCRPADRDGDGIEDKSDSICYAGCSEKKGFGYTRARPKIPEEAFCKSDNGNYLQCLGNAIYSCGEYQATCIGGCQQPTLNHSAPVRCHPGAGPNFANLTGPSCCCIAGDCYIREREGCILAGGYAYSNESSYCKPPEKTEEIEGTIFLKSDGVCDLDCAQSVDVCDPDCPDYLENCIICTPENESYLTGKPCCSGLTACPGTGNCSKTCCGDGFCDRKELWKESDHPKYWENPYTCPSDCDGDTPNRIDSCSAGPFTGSPCRRNITIDFYSDMIQTCSNATEEFLDRREWDINQIADDLLRGKRTPRGFAFDDTKYGDACDRVQNASYTITSQENFNYSGEYERCCCADFSESCGGYPILKECCGTGFCADHATALLSILRRMGIPSDELWATFTLGTSCQPHAVVIYNCSTDLPDNLKLEECDGNWNKWLVLDSTNHQIVPLERWPCKNMCLWYNDYGLYATQLGRINATTGRVYPQDASCSSSTWEGKEVCVTSPTDPNPFSCEFERLCNEYGNGINCVW